jgi:hypothetical protein
MKRIFWETKGFTTVEILVAALFGMIIMATLYGFFRDQLFHLLAQEVKTATLEDARGALDLMVRELRNAGSWGPGSAPSERGSSEDPSNVDDPNNDADSVCNRVYAATEKLVHVQMDLNGDGDCIDTNPRENVKYELTGPTLTCPGSYIIRRNDDCLVADVVPPPGEKIFTYYDSANNDLGDEPPLASIKRIKITFSVQLTNPNPYTRSANPHISSTLSSSVEFRN